MKKGVTDFDILDFNLGMNDNGFPEKTINNSTAKFNFITGINGNGASELRQVKVEDFCLKEIYFDMGGNGTTVY